ncbi:hypothetical protein AHAS_Ahas12G0096700 [Arachis hypogaea]
MALRSRNAGLSINSNKAEWIEQYEPGVYVSLVAQRDGTKVFNKRRFGLRQAETWWSDNQDKVYERYNVRSSEVKSSNQAGAPHRTEGAGSIEGHRTRVLFKSKL